VSASLVHPRFPARQGIRAAMLPPIIAFVTTALVLPIGYQKGVSALELQDLLLTPAGLAPLAATLAPITPSARANAEGHG